MNVVHKCKAEHEFEQKGKEVLAILDRTSATVDRLIEGSKRTAQDVAGPMGLSEKPNHRDLQ